MRNVRNEKLLMHFGSIIICYAHTPCNGIFVFNRRGKGIENAVHRKTRGFLLQVNQHIDDKSAGMSNADMKLS